MTGSPFPVSVFRGLGLRRPRPRLFPAFLGTLLLLQTLACSGSGSGDTTTTSLPYEQQYQLALEIGEDVRQAAIAWIKEEPTVARSGRLGWTSGGSGSLRRMDVIDLPGTEPEWPWLSGPPWVVGEGVFYFQDPAASPDSDGRGWYKITPAGLRQLADSADASEKVRIVAVLDQIRFMLWADPLWVVEHMEITEVGWGGEDGGHAVAGPLPDPDSLSADLEAARAVSGGSPAGWQTSESPLGSTIWVNLETDRHGRPTNLYYTGPGDSLWWWEFERSSGEVSAPSDASDWLPSSD